MSKIKGIYAATLSILNEDLSLNIEKTILHAENIINKGCHGVAFFGSRGRSTLKARGPRLHTTMVIPGGAVSAGMTSDAPGHSAPWARRPGSKPFLICPRFFPKLGGRFAELGGRFA